MKFDIQGARRAGYSDDEIASFLAQERKFDLSAATQAGYSSSEVLDFLAQGPAASAPARVPANDSAAAIDYTDVATSMQGTPTSTDNRGLIKRVGDFFRPAPKPSVMEGYVPTLQDQQAEIDRRLSYGAGPISQETVRQADVVRSSRTSATPQKAQSPQVEKVVKGMDERRERTSADLFALGDDLQIQRGIRDQKAEEWRSAGEWAADTLSGLAQGAVGLAQLPVNIIAPSSALAESLRETQKELQAQESDVLKAQRQVLRERVMNEDGFFGKYFATVKELVTNPALGISEGVKQLPNFLGVVGLARAGGALAAGGVAALGRAAPSVALADAIGGGAITAGAKLAGAVAGGRVASMAMTAGDAAGQTYETLTDPNQTDPALWQQNPDYQKLVADGKSPEEAIKEIATAKARMAALITAPLGLLGFMGAESAVATRGLGKAAADALTFKGAAKTALKDNLGEQLEEAGTAGGGNVVIRQVDPSRSLMEGVPEAAATAAVTSSPFSVLGAASNYQQARQQLEARDPFAERVAADVLRTEPGSSNLIRPEATVVNFTPPDSATKQAGLVDIEVPVPNTPPVFADIAGVTNVGTAGTPGGMAAGSSQPGSGIGAGSLDAAGRGAVDAAGLQAGTAGSVRADDRSALSAGGEAGQPAAGVGRPFSRATDADLLARTEAAVAGTAPAKIWAGRAGDGYATEADANQALPGLQRKNPTLDWSLQQNADGKFIWSGIPKETTLGTQTDQAIQGQAQGLQAQAAGTAATQAGAATAQVELSDSERAGLKLALPAPAPTFAAVQEQLAKRRGVTVEAVPVAELNDSQRVASTVARLLGNTLTVVRATSGDTTAVPNGFINRLGGKHIFVDSKADDAPVSIALHEGLHSLPAERRKTLNTALLEVFNQDQKGEFLREFGYTADKFDEEAPAMMAQAISKRADFWEQLRDKMGNREFGEVAKVILGKLNQVITGAKDQYGDAFVSKYIKDVVKARDLLTTAYAESMQAQGFKPDAELTGEVMASNRAEQKNAAASRIEDVSADRFKRTPALQQALADLQAGTITRAEYSKVVDEARPVYPYKELPEITTEERARFALANGRGQSVEKAAKYGLPAKELTQGEMVQLRLDIPSYQEHDAWVVTVHRPKTTNRSVQAAYDAGPTVGYESVASITNATFGMRQSSALKIAQGTSKGTIATVLGEWKPITPAEAKVKAQAAMKSPEWTQVGMDPFRHSYFYDRDTMRPVVAADEVIQVGPLVLAKNAKFDDELDVTGAPLMFSAKAVETPEVSQSQYQEAPTPARRGADRIGDFDVRTMKDGSIVVYGDGQKIREQIPEDVKGRVTKDGIVFTTSAAPRVKAALEGRKTAYSRGGEVIEKLPMKNGKYVGAPEKYNTPSKIAGLRKSLRKLTLEGERGRYWYENSSREVLAMVGGNVQEARKFVALLAIYSPQAKVDANSTFALRAWAQYKAGQPISVKTGVMDAKAQAAMDNVDAFWSGEKTGNFFFNLLREIDPSTKGKQGATIDMWMMRAGEYNNDAPTATQYAFMENETNRLAQELGWEPQQVQAAIWVAMKARMENSGVKKRTEASSEKKGWIRFDYPLKNGKPVKTRVILNAQAHRDNWLKHAFEHTPTTADTSQAKFDFSDGVRRHIGQISWEARPGRSTGVLPGVNDAPYEQQVEFQQAVQKALLDDNGIDLLAYKLGLLVDGPDILAPGIWQGEVAAGMQKQVVMAPAKGMDGKTSLDPAQKKALDAYAATLGLLLRQEGVGYHRPFYKGTVAGANGVDINVGRTLTPQEAQALWGAIDQRMQDQGVPDWEDKSGMISSPTGIRVVNFGALAQNRKFHNLVEDAASTLAIDELEFGLFSTDGDLIQNNWKDNPNGESYQQRIAAAGSPDLLGWTRDVLAPRVQAVFDEFSSRYGWGDPGTIEFANRAEQAAEQAPAQAERITDLEPADVLRPDTIAAAEAAIAKYKQPDKPDPLTKEQRLKGEILLQPMFDAARKNKPEFDDNLRRIAEEVGGFAKTPGIKKPMRAVTKLVTEMDGNASKMKDLLRGTIVVGDVAAAQAAIDKIGEVYRFDRIKNRMGADIVSPDGSTILPETMPTGYQDILTNVILDDGTIAEIQLTTPEMAAAKHLGHEVYAFEREMPAGAVKDEMVALQVRIYSEGRAAFDSRQATQSSYRDSNTSRETSPAFSRTSEGLRGEGSGTQAVAEDMSAGVVTGTSSQSKNRVPSGSVAKSNGIEASAPSITKPMEEGEIMESRRLPKVSPQTQLNRDIESGANVMEAAIERVRSGRPVANKLLVGRLPHVLNMLGARTQDFDIARSIVEKVFDGKHRDEFPDIKPEDLVRAMYRPAMVFKSKDGVAREFELVLPITNENGAMLVPIKVSVDNTDPTGAVMSIYNKRVSTNLQAQGEKTVMRRINDGNLVYVDPLLAKQALTGRKGSDAKANENFVSWPGVWPKLQKLIADRKVKTDIDLMRWIGDNFDPRTSPVGFEDAPAFSNKAAAPAMDKEVVSLFKDLQDSRGLGRIRVQERVDAHPMAETIRQIDKDFMDILERLDDAGLVKINCK